MSLSGIRGVFERPRGSGVWWARWADAFGQIRYRKAGSKQFAIALYQRRKVEVREAILFPEVARARVTFEEICADFEKAKPNHWSRATGKHYLPIFRKWFSLGPAHLITPQRIAERLNKLEADGRSPATINRYRSVLSAIFNWAVRNGKLQSNPIRSVPMRREENHRVRFLEEAEESRLRAEIRTRVPRREPELTLALNTGMRLSEQYSLTWGDVDLERGFIQLLKTKSGRPRTVPINAAAKSALLELRRRQFRRPTASVCPLASRTWFENCLLAAGISNFRWHDLRHTFASRLVMAGVDLATVQELMGHQTVAMTLRYAHLSDSHKTAAVSRLIQESVPPRPQEAAAEKRPQLVQRSAEK